MVTRIDRRVLRTRQMLRDALMGLIAEKGFDSLTVQDITDRADLRRATFYLHYRDKEELLLDALTETFDALVGEMEPLMRGDHLAGKTRVETFQAMYDHVNASHDLYRIILTGASAAAIMRRIRAYLAEHILRAVGTEALGGVPGEVAANYIAGAEVSLIVWWLENERPYSTTEMAAFAHQLILDGVRTRG